MFDVSESAVDPVAVTHLDPVPVDNTQNRVARLVQCKVCCTQCVCFGAHSDAVDAAKFEKLIDHWPPVSKEKYVIREGDPFDGVLLVRSGSVKT